MSALIPSATFRDRRFGPKGRPSLSTRSHLGIELLGFPLPLGDPGSSGGNWVGLVEEVAADDPSQAFNRRPARVAVGVLVVDHCRERGNRGAVPQAAKRLDEAVARFYVCLVR